MANTRKYNKLLTAVSSLAVISMMLISALFLNSASYADTPKGEISGPDVLRNGESFELVFSISDIECRALEGYITYDKDIVELEKGSVYQPSWILDSFTENLFGVFSEDPGNAELNFKGGKLFSFTFKLKTELEVGSDITITFGNLTAIDKDNKEIKLDDCVFSKKVDPPATGDSTLVGISIPGGELTPGFSPDITEYKLINNVPFECEMLDIAVTPGDPRATVEISGAELRVGYNTVVIKVTSELGSFTEYMVTVRRSHDPAIPQSTNNKISSITLSEGRLTPSFSPDIKEYMVFLPFETERIVIGATPEDEFANDISSIDSEVKEGDNIFILNCVAENGDIAEYKVNAYVMPKYMGFSPDVENKIPLKGEPVTELSTDLKVGCEMRVYLSGATEDMYDIIWFKDGEPALKNGNYIFTDEDRGHTVNYIIVAKGNYSGTYQGPKYKVLTDGSIVYSDKIFPLTGPMVTKGEGKVGAPLSAFLENTDPAAYTVRWYKNGSLVSEGSEYTVTEDDIGAIIYAEIIGKGDYYGNFRGNKYKVLASGKVVMTDDYIGSDILDTKTVFVAIVCASLALGLGIAAGSAKQRRLQKKQNKDQNSEESQK